MEKRIKYAVAMIIAILALSMLYMLVFVMSRIVCYSYADGSRICVLQEEKGHIESSTHESVINPALCYVNGSFYPRYLC
jgi:hypothetical protein